MSLIISIQANVYFVENAALTNLCRKFVNICRKFLLTDNCRTRLMLCVAAFKPPENKDNPSQDHFVEACRKLPE